MAVAALATLLPVILTNRGPNAQDDALAVAIVKQMLEMFATFFMTFGLSFWAVPAYKSLAESLSCYCPQAAKFMRALPLPLVGTIWMGLQAPYSTATNILASSVSYAATSAFFNRNTRKTRNLNQNDGSINKKASDAQEGFTSNEDSRESLISLRH